MASVSCITWSNDWQEYVNTLLPSLAMPFQMGYREMQPIIVPPEAGAANIGQAYNMARQYAKHKMRVFVHQDVKILDRLFFEKLDEMFLDPKVGAVGVIGSVVDTGAGFFHTVPRNKRGTRYGGFYPERCKVALVDGFMLATNLDLPFSEEYETTHMAIEDFCMQVRAAGKEVWTVDALCEHKSGGTLDPAYWRSVSKFRRNWKHALPRDMFSVRELKKRVELLSETIEMNIHIDVVGDPVEVKQEGAVS